MKGVRSSLHRIHELLFRRGDDIRIAAFNILALCGITVSLVTAVYNYLMGFGLLATFTCLAGVAVSVALMLFTVKTGN